MYLINIDAYCISESTVEMMKVVSRDVSLVRSKVNIEMGGTDSFVRDYGSSEKSTEDVIVLEISDDPSKAVEDIGKVFELLSQNTAIIVLGKIDSIPFKEEIMEGGVTDYILLPTNPNIFLQRISRIFRDDERGMLGKGKVISVFGAKGGVGTSTVAQNLAWSLQNKRQKSVTLVDLDVHFGTVSINLNLDQRIGLRDALSRSAMGASNLDAGNLERFYNKKIEGASYLWTMASNPSLYDSTNIFTSESVQRVIDIITTQASYVVIDMPQIWDPALTNILALSHETIIVGDHSLQSLRNTQMLFENISSSKPQNTYMKYILNHAGIAPLNDLSSKDFIETLGLSPSAIIPWNLKGFRMSSSEGKPLAEIKGQEKLVKIFDDLSEIVVPESEKEIVSSIVKSKKPGLFSKLFSKK